MNYPDWYRTISSSFRTEMAEQAIIVLDRALVALIAAAYIGSAIMLFVMGDFLRGLRFLAVPAIAFALVSYLRNRWDAPRPYELYDIDPIIHKDTEGRSMPSRHVASAVIIACALAWVHLDWGVLAFVVSAIVSFTRIVGGVHFPRDIAAAWGISLACGILGFAIIPG